MFQLIHFINFQLRKSFATFYYPKLFLASGRNNIFYGKAFVSYPEKIKIGSHCSFNENVVLNGRFEIEIEDHVTLSNSTSLYSTGLDLQTWPQKEHSGSKIHIKEHVWIGANTLILPGVTIGENSVIGAGSIVTKDIPANSLAVGNPAKTVKTLTTR